MTSNTVEFVLRMRDLMSGNLSKLSSASQSAFGKMAQHADQMNKRNKVLGMSFEELQKKIRDVETTIKTSNIPSQIADAKRELASLQRMSGKHIGNVGGSSGSSSGGFSVGGMAIGSTIGNIATKAATAFIEIVKDGIGGAISGSMQKEQDIVGLTTFLGKKGAEDAYKNIRQDANITPYDTASLLKVNRALISTGMSAKDAREDTMNLANAVSAVGGGNDELMRMAVNMQQIKQSGKAEAQDIKQFAYAGIDIHSLLKGKKKGDDITYNDIAKGLAEARMKGGKYAGALEAQGQTMAGKWSTVKDNAQTALTDIGDAFSPVINKVLDVGIKFANSIQPMLQKMQPYIDYLANGLGMAIDYVLALGSGTGAWSDWLEIAKSIVFTVYTYISKVLSVVWHIVSGVVQWLAKSEIIKDVFRLISWLVDKIYTVVGWIGDGLVWVWDNVLKPILDGIDDAYKWVKDLVGGDEPLKVEATKKVVEQKDNKQPSYFADLTRFKGSGSASAIDEGEEKKKKNKERSQKIGDTVSGGGPRTINITLGKFFDNIQFTTLNGSESAEKLEGVVMECMGRVLYDGAKVM